MCTRSGWVQAVLAGVLGVALAGCGTPGAPQPPSLDLPDRVTDLAPTRTGDRVSLTWIMPKKNTDKLLLKGDVDVRVCRREGTGTCERVDSALRLAPGAAGSFAETLPQALASGAPRALTYFVELKNRNGRSAGLSNAAVVAAGQAPAPVTELTAEVRKAGVVLRWTPDGENLAVRLQRKLLTPPPAKPKQGMMAPAPEPIEQNLLVETGSREALDKSIHFGETYEYRAQRVARVDVDGKKLDLEGELSQPVRVEVKDVFPPEVPTDLAAVAAVGENGAGPGNRFELAAGYARRTWLGTSFIDERMRADGSASRRSNRWLDRPFTMRRLRPDTRITMPSVPLTRADMKVRGLPKRRRRFRIRNDTRAMGEDSYEILPLFVRRKDSLRLRGGSRRRVLDRGPDTRTGRGPGLQAYPRTRDVVEL